MNKNDKVWNVVGSYHFYEHPAREITKLENVHYILGVTERGYFLEKVGTSFELPKKIYGNDGKFADRVLKTWNARKKNVGVLLNGIKGSGKTVTSKTICNNSNLPIIMITHAIPGAEKFLSTIQQDIIVFIDEYEKIYEKSDNMLTLMDGALSNEHRRMFIMTTNMRYVSEYMLDRPNRVLYNRSYDEVSIEVINDMVDDLLIRKEWKNDLVKFFASLVTLTIDIIGNVIEEVNIHDEVPEEFKDFFNVTQNQKAYDVYYHPKAVNGEKAKKVLLAMNYTRETKFTARHIDNSLTINGDYLGYIKAVNKDGTLGIQLLDKNYIKKFPALLPLVKKRIKISFQERGYVVHNNFSGMSGEGFSSHEKTLADGGEFYDEGEDLVEA